MRLHATQIVRAWAQNFPADQLTVVGPRWAVQELQFPNVRVKRWPNENVVFRAIGQIFVTAFLAFFLRAERVVSLSPVVSPFLRKSQSVCFNHDWRHKKVPGEFGMAQRTYRKLWELSAARAGLVVCISKKTEQETRSFVPKARTVVVPNGSDHARDWLQPSRSKTDSKIVVTFGHHNNKRPELVIDAFSQIGTPFSRNSQLVVLGAKDDYRDALVSRTARLGISSRVTFPGFVTEREYQRVISSADAIVLASSDEGFGLPIVEARYFGIPAIVTTDSGLAEIHTDLLVAWPSGPSLAVALQEALTQGVSAAEPVHCDTSWAARTATLRGLVAGPPQRERHPRLGEARD